MVPALRKLLPPLVALVIILALWEGLTRALHIKAFELPPPSAIFLAALKKPGPFFQAMGNTAKGALLGFSASAVFGILAAVILASSRTLERALSPYTVFLQTVPIVAIAPLLVLWFGPGIRAITVSAFIVSVFPVIANTLAGLRSVEPALRDLFRLYGASRSATLLRLSLPSALPSIVTGLRVASGLSVIGTIVGEAFLTIAGWVALRHFQQRHNATLDTPPSEPSPDSWADPQPPPPYAGPMPSRQASTLQDR